MTLQEYNDIYKNPCVKKMTIHSSGGVTITNENIVSEQMSLESTLCSEQNLRYGRCEADCFKVRIADMNHDFTGEILSVVQDVYTDERGYLLSQTGDNIVTQDGTPIVLSGYDGDEAEAYYGIYKVYSDTPTNDRRYRDLVCYDAMRDILNADVADWYNNLRFPMSIYQFRNSFFNELGILQVSTSLCNDSYVIQGGFSVSGTLSGKAVIEAICEMNGVFGHITADNKFKYVSLKDAQTLTLDWYIDGTGTYEDYTTQKVTGIKARGNGDDVGTEVGTTTNMYIIENNPLVYGNEGTSGLRQALNRLLNQIKDDTYRPFEVSTYGNPMLPLGTIVTINSRDKTIVSYVLRKELTGIQSLKDRLSSTGNPKQEEQTNSLRSEVKRTKGTVHELVIDVNGLTSRVSSTETNLQNNYSTTTQTQGMIQNSATAVLSQVSSTYVTQSTYNDEIQNLQDQIDGRIEYFDGNVIPTLNNYPANTWTTAATKDSHVGDLYRYHYTESGEEKVKYYRFDKDTSTTPVTYAWLELGESEVDEALRLANEANQKATQAQADLEDLQEELENNYSTTTQMQSTINQTAQSIVSTVSKSQDKYDESDLPQGVTISEYGYGVPTIDASEHSGEYYLDNLTGQMYHSNGTAWSTYGEPLDKVTDNMQSEISQQANEVVVKVDDGGRLVTVALGTNASSGSHFSVKADDIAFVANGNIQLTAAQGLGIDSPNFKVSPGGEITATSGKIGGWDISATTLSSTVTEGGTDYGVLLVPWRDGLTPANNAIIVRSKLSSASSWTNQFSVAWNGKMVARNAEVTGTITTGNLTATGGHIGSFNINTASISSEYVSGNTRRISYWNANTGNPAQNCFVIRHTTDGGSNYTYPFVLRYDGRLTATDAHITGEVTATSGTVGGWTITASKIYSGSLSTGVAVMQAPTDTNMWTFASGGTSHSAYSDCPFRVDKRGNTIMRWLIVSKNAGSFEDRYLDDKNQTTLNVGSISLHDNTGLLFNVQGTIPGSSVTSAHMMFRGDMQVIGSKSRIADTEDYGKRLLYCYETPTPMFGDLGEGKIAEDGKCYVWLDSTFSETIKTQNYQVFLQKYGQGECYVTERTERYFVVEGTPDMKFGWEIKARQSGFENMRLDSYYEQDSNKQEEPMDYAQEAIRHLEIIKDEREVA